MKVFLNPDLVVTITSNLVDDLLFMLFVSFGVFVGAIAIAMR